MMDWDTWIDAVTEAGESTDDPCWYAMYNVGLTPTEAVMTDEHQRDIFARSQRRADLSQTLDEYDYYA